MAETRGETDTESRDVTSIPSEVSGKTRARTSEGSVGASPGAETPVEKDGLCLTTTYAFAQSIHEHLASTVTFADQKAAFLFGVVGVVLAYLHTRGATRRLLMNPLHWKAADVVACVAVLSLAAGAILLLLVVVPRFGPAAEGLVYYNAIAGFRSPEDFADRVLGAGAQELARAQLQDSFHLARICRRKYAAVSKGTWCSCVGLAAAVLYIAMLN